jgi:hypothetical protein
MSIHKEKYCKIMREVKQLAAKYRAAELVDASFRELISAGVEIDEHERHEAWHRYEAARDALYDHYAQSPSAKAAVIAAALKAADEL